MLISNLALGCHARVEGSTGQQLLRLCGATFRQLEALYKWTSTVSARLEGLISLVSHELQPALYRVISYTSTCQQGESLAKVKREAKLIPSLVQQVEKWEATVVKLSKKLSSKTTKRDFIKLMRRSTNRDFKISGHEVEKLLHEREEREQQKEKQREEKEHRKEERVAKKMKSGGGSSRNKGKENVGGATGARKSTGVSGAQLADAEEDGDEGERAARDTYGEYSYGEMLVDGEEDGEENED
uniref:FANCI solenoid 4 domain-containing protein n=1 Tax=Coccolithus braarudii TaxID=221442 RepID=A0A7S0Q653_9EUKA